MRAQNPLSARQPACEHRRVLGVVAVVQCHFDSFNILNAPCPTMRNTIDPTIKSGYFEFVKYTYPPAKITPRFTITSLEVKIMLACMCISLLLLF